jgi:predicted nucleic acid-binding protein
VKTYVFDAGALIAYLDHKAGATKVNELLKEAVRGHSRILMSAVNYGEVYVRALRERGAKEAFLAMSAVRKMPIEILDATTQRAFRAAEIKTTYQLYYVDAFAAALAIEVKATLVTSDSDFRKMGHSFHVLWLRPN